MNRNKLLCLLSLILLLIILITLFFNIKENFNLKIGNEVYYGDFPTTCKACTYNNDSSLLSCSCNNKTRSFFRILNKNNKPYITNTNDKLAKHNNQFISIRHNTGKCIRPVTNTDFPSNFTEAALHNGCDNDRYRFRFTNDNGKSGRIIHKTSGMCLRPAGRSGIGNNARIQFAPANECRDSRSIFNLLDNGSIQHSSGKCIHPLGGSENPGNNTRIVLYDGCGIPRNTLKYSLVQFN